MTTALRGGRGAARRASAATRNEGLPQARGADPARPNDYHADVSPDPWTSFLEWLQTFLVPEWDSIIAMLPLLLLLGVVGPILTLMMLMQVWYLMHRRRGRVRIAEAEAIPAPLGADGEPVFPPNVPFCEEHAVIYPPASRNCEIDRAELTVRCPVDSTARPASQQVCRACGTRYVLGASRTPIVVRRTGRPPEGGAAVA